MNHLFGKKKEPAKAEPTTTDAVAKMDEHIQSMEKRAEFLQKKIDKELQNAKDCSKRKDKRGALMALKRKNLYVKEQTQLVSTTFAMQQQRQMLETANMTASTARAMKEGTTAMKAVQKELNVDQVEDTMDEVREQMDEMQEIQDAMGQDLSGGMFDEDELESELAELEEEALDEALLDISAPVGVAGPAVGLPDAVAVEPEPAPAVSAEEDELAALEAQMAQ